MKVRAFLIFLCCCIFSAACTKSAAENESVNKTVIENQPPTENTASPTPAKKGDTESTTAGKCRPEKVSLSPGLPENSDMNALTPKPETREEFNEWLGGSNNLKVAEIPNRKDIREYYGEGDFNGDGCRDIAIIVGGTEDKTGEISLENQEVSVTLQNLRTNAVFNGGDVKKLPYSKDFAAQIKPQQPLAIFMILGGERGWSWKFGGSGRTFLLYDSIFSNADEKTSEENSIVFEVVEKNKPEQDDDDLIALFPKGAKGDCVHTETQTKSKTAEFAEGKNRLLICFENDKFAAKKLPDTKYFPE